MEVVLPKVTTLLVDHVTFERSAVILMLRPLGAQSPLELGDFLIPRKLGSFLFLFFPPFRSGRITALEEMLLLF